MTKELLNQEITLTLSNLLDRHITEEVNKRLQAKEEELIKAVKRTFGRLSELKKDTFNTWSGADNLQDNIDDLHHSYVDDIEYNINDVYDTCGELADRLDDIDTELEDIIEDLEIELTKIGAINSEVIELNIADTDSELDDIELDE